MKQFLLICDENGMNMVKSMFKPECFQFLEVQGMTVDNKNIALTTPMVNPLPPTETVPAPEQETVVDA